MIDVKLIKFEKLDGLVPVVIQDWRYGQVLMVGFMNCEAVEQTVETKKVTFYSRSKNKLWVKGEESGNFLHVKDLHLDCDNDTILIFAEAEGPTCHTGNVSCFGDSTRPAIGVLGELENVINQRVKEPNENSYTAKLLNEGVGRIAQKVGEEGIEVALASVHEFDPDKFKGEVSDLIYHLLVLLKVKNIAFQDVISVLSGRDALPPSPRLRRTSPRVLI